jgi:type VI secretion system protein
MGYPFRVCGYGLFVEQLSIRVDFDANNDSATSVDVVVAYDETLFKEILALPADKYFAQAKQYKRDYPQALDIFHWEVVPGQLLLSERLHYRKSYPAGGVMFARYIAPGDHRRRLGGDQYLEVHLKKDGYEITPLKSDTASLTQYKEPE